MFRDQEDASLLTKDGGKEHVYEILDDHQRRRNQTPPLRRFILPVLLSVSILLNILLVANSTPNPKSAAEVEREKTRYAGLDYTSSGTWEADSVYTQENLTAADEAWLALNIDYAFVALTADHASSLDLPPSLHFPWDQGKDLYLLSSVHSVHCLQVLHRSNLEYRTKHTQTYTTEHILHCLENIRLDLTCNADDTPRFVPRMAHESTAKTGVGQLRQCRDWNQLETWAKEHSACFNYHEFERKELEEGRVYPAAWSFCGKDSEYLSKVQQFYGKPGDWVPEDGGIPDIDAIRGKGVSHSPIPAHKGGH